MRRAIAPLALLAVLAAGGAALFPAPTGARPGHHHSGGHDGGRAGKKDGPRKASKAKKARRAHKARTVAVASYHFTNKTGSTVQSVTRTWGSTWADFDDDGDPDLFVSRHWSLPQFLVNVNDEFHRYGGSIDWEPGPKQTDRHACAWGEANKDGKPDLYCVQGADRGKGTGPNRLYIQAPGGGFKERGHEWDTTDPQGRGRTINWLDYDSDGDLDVFVGNAARSGHPNVMFRNGHGRFSRASVGLGQELSTVGSSWADWDRDGDPDLLIEQHHPGVTFAYENVHKHYRPVGINGVTGKTWLSGTWGDYNGDGWPDLVMVGNNRAVIFRNRHGHLQNVRRFKVVHGRMASWLDVENDGDLDLFLVQGAKGNHETESSENRPDLLIVRRDRGWIRFSRHSFAGPIDGNGDAVATADYDRDGRVDVFVTNGYFHFRGANVLLRNTSRSRNWAGLQLQGRAKNPLGFGATVRVKAGGMLYKREITDNFSFRSQSEVGYVSLGLGKHRTARVRVTWSNGQTDCRSITEGSITSIQQGRSRC